METSLLHRKQSGASGFTLIETMVAITILAIGMLGVAALMGQMSGSSTQSRYMSVESLLASEKLEDLNRAPSDDPSVVAGGSLTNDVTNYFDQVQSSAGNGSVVETVTQPNGSGGFNYLETTHLPNGTMSTQTFTTAPSSPDTLTFKRRWVVETNAPVAGVRRITVSVILQNAVVGQSAVFQTTMVRP